MEEGVVELEENLAIREGRVYVWKERLRFVCVWGIWDSRGGGLARSVCDCFYRGAMKVMELKTIWYFTRAVCMGLFKL